MNPSESEISDVEDPPVLKSKPVKPVEKEEEESKSNGEDSPKFPKIEPKPEVVELEPFDLEKEKAKFPEFHIAIDGPADSTFPSFHSWELGGGDPDMITLADIRERCSISSKLYFTADGKNRIAESTTIRYYMQITGRDYGLFNPKDPGKAPAPQPKQGSRRQKGQKVEPKKEALIKTVIVQVTSPSKKAAGSLLALPTIGKELAAFLDKADSGELKRGDLPSISEADRKLLGDSIVGAKALQNQYNVAEPSELTETQWDHILANNRALYGFHVDPDTQSVRKARRPAFQMIPETRKSTQKPAMPSDPSKVPASAVAKQSDPDAHIVVRQIPPFYVYDDAKVEITEIASATKRTLVDEGFTSRAMESNVSLKGFEAAASLGFTSKTEKGSISQTERRDKTSSLHVAYKFPRVVVELDSSCLELTSECREDAEDLVDQKGVDRFYKKYGSEFTTRFTLGGRLHSYRSLSEEEKKNLEQTKDKTRTAAGVSFQITPLSSSTNAAMVTSNVTDRGDARLFQDLRLTWEATGGNTLLCSNPPEWAATVKDHRLWRVMDKDEVTPLQELIMMIDTSAYTKLIEPSAESFRGKDPLEDPAYLSSVETTLNDMLNSEHGPGSDNAMVKRIKAHYKDPKFDQKGYNEFVEKVWKVKDARIDELSKWETLRDDQKMGVGIWCVKLDVIRI